MATGRLFDVTRFGAKGNGTTLDTRALQSAIDACAAAGGGIVLLPPGRYLSGALSLRSNVNFHVGAGAVVVASRNFADFPPIPGRWEGIERTTYSSLLTGHELENVTVSGQGTLEGEGPVWWEAFEAASKLRAAAKLGREEEGPPEALLKWPRPRLINFIRCQRALVADIALMDSPSYNIQLTYCQNARVENVTQSRLSTSSDSESPSRLRAGTTSGESAAPATGPRR